MGIKHLKQIEKFLSDELPRYGSHIARDLNMDYNTALECLKYLLANNKVTKEISEEGVRYRWIKKN